MASDFLEDLEVVLTRPLYGAFKRELPEELEDPSEMLGDLVGHLDEQIGELESVAQHQGAQATLERAAEFRKSYVEFDKKATKETTAKKKDGKKIAKLTEEGIALGELISAEMQVPIREAGMTKALQTLQTRNNPPRDKVTAFEKRAENIAKEKDPKKRCDLYFHLERDILKADLLEREALDPGSTWQDQVEMGLGDSKPIGIVGKVSQGLSALKNKVLRRPPPGEMSDEEFAGARTAFVNSYTKKINDMAFSVPEVSAEQFKGEAADLIEAIANDLFDPLKKPDNQHLFGKLLVKANTLALQRLLALKRDYPANQTPQVMVEDGKLVVIKPAPKTQSLVLQGGGSKGAGYPPMLEEMKKAGTLDNVDLLVGTSIGALNASCLACGGLADERQILDMPIMKNVFDSKNFKKQYPDVSFGHPYLSKSDVLPSCAGQMAKIDQMTSMSIANNLKDKSEDAIGTELAQKLNNLDDETLAKMGLAGASVDVIEREVKKLAKKIKSQDLKSGDRTTQMITFKDLAMLHQLDPVNFKELTITGWEGLGDEGHVEYFNAKNYGDMPIALAARISMGLPIFSPVYWNGRGPFYDGGLGSNTPVEATPGLDEFYKKNNDNPSDVEEALKGDVPVDVQEAMAKTMLMTFDDQGKGEQNLYGQGRKTATPGGIEKVAVIATGINEKYGETLTKDGTKVYNTGVNTMQVFHGAMGTVTIAPSEEDFEYAENMSRMKGLEQIDARSDQAAVFKCTNSDEALLGMSSSDKRNFVKAGRPGGDPLVGELFDKCVEFVKLEDLFQGIGDDSNTFLAALANSPLCATFRNDITELQTAYIIHAKGTSSAEALKSAIQTAGGRITGCPAYLQPMLKKAVLLPMQQRNRSLPKPTVTTAPTFLWQQAFTASAFNNSLTVAEKDHVPYLKEATSAHDALNRYDKLNQELVGKSTPKDKCQAARKALAALETFQFNLRKMGQADPYPKIPTLQAYIQWLSEKALVEVDRLRALAKGKDAAYPRYAFTPWNKKDWQDKKGEAIKSGAIEDLGSSGLGDQMANAVKAEATWMKASEGAKEKTGKAAWNAWDKVARTARDIQSRTDNANFSAYLEECVTAATRQRDLLPPP